MFVLGIDPGLTRTGYGIIESHGQTDRAIAAGVIRTSVAASTSERLLELEQDMNAVLDEHQIDTAAVEQVFINRNRNTAISVARASGVLIAAVGRRGIQIAEYTPTQMKMAITGSGAADKEQISAVVAMRLSLGDIEGPADVADALGIALCHAQHAAATAAGALR